jgi:pimeloyl-ACP methyl ester carboxylesterase
VLVALLAIEPLVCHVGLHAAEAEDAVSTTGPPLPRYALGLGFLHPLPALEPDVNQVCRSLPQRDKDHVYVFLINGLDPLYLANLNGLCAYLRALGFAQAEVGQMTSSSAFRDKIRQVRLSDPQARIALIGFSAGAYFAQGAVQTLKNENISIDLLIYIGADMIREGERAQPANVQRVVNITGHGFLLSGYDLFFNGTALPGARNVRLPARHFALPSRPETLQIVVEELVALIYQDPIPVDRSAEPAVKNRNIR